MAGLQIKIPAVFTDPTLPILLPSLGTSVLPDARWSGRSLAALSDGQALSSWADAIAGQTLTPTKQATTPPAGPPIVRVDTASQERFVRFAGNLAVTFQAAADAVTFPAAHGYNVGDQVAFTNLTGAAGITAGQIYYVKTVPTSTTMTLSATAGGATLDITSDGSGSHAQALSNLLSDMPPANYQTVAMVIRRPAGGNGIVWSGGGALITDAPPTAQAVLAGNTAAAPTANNATANVWHLIVLRLNAAATKLTVDGVDGTGTPTDTAYGGAEHKLVADGTFWGTQLDIIELASFSSVLSDADVAAMRTALKAAYPGLALP